MLDPGLSDSCTDTEIKIYYVWIILPGKTHAHKPLISTVANVSEIIIGIKLDLHLFNGNIIQLSV